MKKYLVVCLFFTLIVACDTSEKGDQSSPAVAGNNEARLDSINLQFVMINDSLQTSWMEMIKDDNEKFANMKRLLQEVSFTKNYDKETYDELMTRIDQMSVIRYNMETMANSNKIDEYDAVSNALSNDVTQFVVNHPDYGSYPLMDELIEDIHQADYRILLHRIKYDQNAKQYNHFIHEHKDAEIANERLNASWKERPLFELSD